MKITKVVSLVVCLLVALAWTAGASAQTATALGEIRGTTLDPNGGGIPKTTVTLSNPSTGYSRTIQADENGVFVFAQVPAGTYALRAEAPNFAVTTVKEIELHVGASLNVDVNMPLKTQVQTVEVTSGAPIETTTTGISQLINDRDITNLPLFGRDFRDLAKLSQSAQVVPGLRGGVRMGGQMSDYSGLVVDGGDTFNNFFGENFGSIETKNFTIPMDAVEEFQVVTSGFAPEFGRSTGGLLNVVTKSGTNEFHGTGHYFIRTDSTTANDALGFAPKDTRQQIFGGTVGFPIHKDRQWLFAALDFQREYGPLVTRFCPTIVPGVCDETLLASINLDPKKYGASTMAALEGPHPQHQNLYTAMGHYDWQMTPKNHFSARLLYTGNFTDGFSGGRGQNEVTFSFGNTEKFHDQGLNGVLALNSVFGRKVNEIRVMVSGETRPRKSNSNGVEVFINGIEIGQRFFLPIDNDQGKLQAQDNFGYSFGKHDMKWGGDVDSFVDRKDTFAGWNVGEYFFASLADFRDNINGVKNNPVGFIQGFGLNGKTPFQAGTLFPVYQTGVGFYWQDRWQPSPRLTLTYGIRWDNTFNPQPQHGTPGRKVLVGVGSGSHAIAPPQRVPNDFTQFGPRIGVAYRMGGNEHPIVIRGAWGLYYAQAPPIFFDNNGNSTHTTLFCCAKPAAGYPTIFPSTFPPNTDLCTTLVGCPGIDSYVDPAFKNPRVSNLTGSVEYELFKDLTISSSYAYVHSWYLPTGGLVGSSTWSRNFTTTGTPDQFGRSILTGLLDPTLSSVNEIGSFARGNYHQFVAGVNKRFSRHFQFFGSYTWSRNYSNAVSERDTDTFFGPQDPINVNIDYGRNNLDVTHQFRGAGVAELPFGLTLSGTITAHSGLPYPAYVGANTDFGLDLNGDGVVNQFAMNDRPVVQIGSGKPFLLERYPAHQPSFAEWDMRVTKDFRFKERFHAQFMADLFNITNRANLYSNPDNSGYINIPGPCNPKPVGLGLDCAPLTAIPKPGDPNPISGIKYRTLDQIVSGTTPFAAQFGFKFIW